MVIDNSVRDIELKNVDDVIKSIEIDMLSGDFVRWTYANPYDCEEVEISTCVSASDYLAFIRGVKAHVPSKLTGSALIMYRVQMSASGNEFALFGVQK